MPNEYKWGDCVLYKDQIVYVLQMQSKPFNLVLVEWIEDHPQAQWLERDWVHNSALTPLDPAVSSLLSSIYNHQK